MAEEKIFVGRKAELEQFKEVLKNPKGQAVLVVGPAGMGKTWLVNKMVKIAENHPELKCGWVRYEVTPTDSVDSTMALMMDETCEAAKGKLKRFVKLKGRAKQWSALLSACGLIPIVGNKVKALGELVLSLRREPTKDTRTQFIRKLNQISEKMPKDRRAIFIIDPEKYMQEKSDQSWAIVVKDLPEKIKFVFAQRPENAMVDSETFDELDNVVCIPEKENQLGVLEEESVDELINIRCASLDYSEAEIREVLSRYQGHPYALGAALDLLEAGTKLEELPKEAKPIKFAQKQWERVKEIKHGAVELFEAYAILEVGVPDDVVEAVSGLKPAERKGILGERYLKGLLREEGAGRRIYHAILADYIIGQISEVEKKEYHSRAVEVYREKLEKAKREQTKPDALAAMRLPEHVLAAEGEEAFVDAFVVHCSQALIKLGLLDAAYDSLSWALELVKRGSKYEAILASDLGLIHSMRGEWEKAEKMHLMSFKVDVALGRLSGMASQYSNLGEIYFNRGDMNKAGTHFRKSLEIAKKIGDLEMMGRGWGNLATVHLELGELDKAENLCLKALEIDTQLGRLEGQAIRYGNLGIIHKKRGDLDKAEQMYKKALEIDTQLGRIEGQAIKYNNLAAIYYERGDTDKAKDHWEKSLELCKKIGMPHMVDKVQGWIEGIEN